MLGVAPILPSRDLEATSAFYSQLGFGQTQQAPDLDPSTSIAASGIPRLHTAPQDSDYGLREFALVDHDGNLLRIGSFIGQPG